MNIKEFTKSKLNKLWESPEYKPFVAHLLKAYLPLVNSKKLIDWDQVPKNKAHRCALTSNNVVSISEIISDLNKDDNHEIMMRYMDGNFMLKQDKMENPFGERYENKILAYTGTNTDTVLCLEALYSLNDWATEMILEGKVNKSVLRIKNNKKINDDTKE